MTLSLKRWLLVWAAALMFAVLAVLSLADALRVAAAIAVAGWLTVAWRRAGHQAARRSAQLSQIISVPQAAYRQPVLLVCGDSLDGLFGAAAVVRLTEQGCYLRVPGIEQLPAFVENVLTLRPDWDGQLSAMLIVNPGAHTDSAELAGHLRAFRHQVALVRKRGVELPLLLVSYVQGGNGEQAWFDWDAGRSVPNVHAGGACVSLAQWQSQSADGATRVARLHSSVQLNSAADWLLQHVGAHICPLDTRRSIDPPLACAIALVPAVPQSVAGSLWQQWLHKRTALDQPCACPPIGTSLPFPDPLMHLLPVRYRHTPARRAAVMAMWMFALAGLVALLNSAWQNTRLLRQVDDDLRHYHALPVPDGSNRSAIALREEAVSVLRHHARRLDDFHRYGEPLSLGLGLYQGEHLRSPLFKAIADHRPPPAPVDTPAPVRLDSLSLFSTGSDQLKPGSTKVLIEALVNIKAQPGWLIVIAGHTDATGSAEHNLRLSRARAAAVRDWMQRMGNIPDSCFAVQGFGASQPVAGNDTDSGRAANRRVDIRLVPEAGACALLAAGPDRNPLSRTATVKN
jgi:outer membrane protein OmpA-like peptidoglycan-associated protein